MRLWFDSQTLSGNLNWEISGPTGITNQPTSFDSDDQNTGLLQPGTYTLTVSGRGTYTGSFAFNLLSFAAATTISPGTALSGNLPVPNGSVLYKFAANTGDNDSVTILGSATTARGHWYLIDPYGNTVVREWLPTSDSAIALNVTGTYTLVMAGSLANTLSPAAYSFQVNFNSNTPPAAIASTAPNSGECSEFHRRSIGNQLL